MFRLPDQGRAEEGRQPPHSTYCRQRGSRSRRCLARPRPALAQVGPDIPPDIAERVAFDAADTDGDGYVNEAELARDAAVGFGGLDTDRNETLTPPELAPHDPAWFARIDRYGDGVLTFIRGHDEQDQGPSRRATRTTMAGCRSAKWLNEVEAEAGGAS